MIANAKYKVELNGYGKCPLCDRKWQNPAILPSGWVVCWRCGWDAVEGEDEDEDENQEEGSEEKERTPKIGKRRGVCPITGVEVAPGELRRVLV